MRFSTEMKSLTGLSSFRLLCVRTLSSVFYKKRDALNGLFQTARKNQTGGRGRGVKTWNFQGVLKKEPVEIPVV